jgi:aldose sugar dehydrogenase
MVQKVLLWCTTGSSTGIGRALVTLALVAGLVSGAPVLVQGQAPHSPTPTPMNGAVRVQTIARGLEHPWALAFLPDGRMLVTERPGRLRIVGRDGRVSEPLAGVPQVLARGQGGLLDVTLDPSFADNRLVYLSYAEPGEGRTAGTAVARGQLGEGRLEDIRVIYQQQPKVKGANHFGSRLVFARDGTLFVTQGERFDYRDQAQDLSSGLGKIVRINPDGSVPRNNPFVGRAGARPEIWSYGHRNVQSAARHPQTGQLWTVEHGARGGDELNRPEAGKNYGWPVISYGVHYSWAKVRRSRAWSSRSTTGIR